jgi:hypothetical protein
VLDITYDPNKQDSEVKLMSPQDHRIVFWVDWKKLLTLPQKSCKLYPRWTRCYNR